MQEALKHIITGRGVQMCNKTTFQYFERGTRAKDPKSMTELAECYLFGLGIELDDLLALVVSRRYCW